MLKHTVVGSEKRTNMHYILLPAPENTYSEEEVNQSNYNVKVQNQAIKSCLDLVIHL
jgi:hypothetical protein